MDMHGLAVAAFEGLVVPHAKGQAVLLQLGLVCCEGDLLLPRDCHHLEGVRLHHQMTASVLLRIKDLLPSTDQPVTP